MTKSTNLERLQEGGIVPTDYEDHFTDAEMAAIESLTTNEVDAIISSAAKMDPEFIKRHAPHGILY